MKIFAGLLMLWAMSAQAADMTELRYMEQDFGSPPYPTRILITEKFLRMDSGTDDGSFVLFNRQTGDISNVVPEDKMLTRMINKPLPAGSPTTYAVDDKLFQVTEGTVRVQVLANGKICSETVAVKSLFPNAARALAEYKAALAYTQLQTYRNTPDGMRQNCDLVHHVWETDRALAHGLPIEERDYAGKTRTYVGGTIRDADDKLFRIPDEYIVLHVPEFD